MNMQTKGFKLMHDALVRAGIEPGKTFASALAWCEDYCDRELTSETPEAAQRAVRAYLRETRR